MSFDSARREYEQEGLDLSALDADPIAQFQKWYAEAEGARVDQPNACVLATATPDGLPNARVVLLKGLDERGFVFFTNFESEKGKELAENPHGTLVFHWGAHDRQVRVRGAVARLPAEETVAYWAKRPRGSRIAAWASEQSAILEGRAALEARVREVEERFAGAELPVPPFWGGLRLAPETIEFWQGRVDRLHDRLRYVRGLDQWRIERLSP